MNAVALWLILATATTAAPRLPDKPVKFDPREIAENLEFWRGDDKVRISHWNGNRYVVVGKRGFDEMYKWEIAEELLTNKRNNRRR